MINLQCSLWGPNAGPCPVWIPTLLTAGATKGVPGLKLFVVTVVALSYIASIEGISGTLAVLARRLNTGLSSIAHESSHHNEVYV